MKVHLLLCGQIRDLAFLDHMARQILMFRDLFGTKVIVTWQEDLDLLGPQRVAALELQGFHLIAAPKPHETASGSGSFVYQMSQLLTGLRALPAGSLVLKSRPDVWLSWDRIGGLLRAYEARRSPADGLAGLRQRIWVRYAHAVQPLGLPDVAFLGLREDLLKIANMDAELSVLSEGRHAAVPIAELRLWTSWFRRVFPVFDEYQDFLCRTDLSRMELDSSLWLDDSRFRIWLGAYYELLRRYFLIGTSCYDGMTAIVRRFSRRPDGMADLAATDQAPDLVAYGDVPGTFRAANVGWMTFAQELWLTEVAPYFTEGAAMLDPDAFRPDPEAVRRLAYLGAP